MKDGGMTKAPSREIVSMIGTWIYTVHGLVWARSNLFYSALDLALEGQSTFLWPWPQASVTPGQEGRARVGPGPDRATGMIVDLLDSDADAEVCLIIGHTFMGNTSHASTPTNTQGATDILWYLSSRIGKWSVEVHNSTYDIQTEKQQT